MRENFYCDKFIIKKKEIKWSKNTIFLIVTETFVIHKVKMSRTKHHPIIL